ncbi:MAG: nucleotide-diphospho-sugar transferase [Cyclobacteriaceae bacterium]
MIDIPPVLVLIFNRPDKTELLIKHLSTVKPQKLYIAADGPRSEKESQLTEKTRKVIEEHINWDCEIQKRYRSENLGLRVAVSSAIDWFFESERAGVILEDDCLPDPTFFQFCKELLEKYKDNDQIMHISALNSFPKPTDLNGYHFSIYPKSWGWATWKRAWEKYDDSIEKYQVATKSDKWSEMFQTSLGMTFWKLIIEKMSIRKSRMRSTSWAYFWTLSVRYHDGLCINPNVNTIKNIGFDLDATNTSESGDFSDYMRNIAVESIQFPLIHPSDIKSDKEEDHKFLKYHLINSRTRRFLIYLKMIFPFLKPLK